MEPTEKHMGGGPIWSLVHGGGKIDLFQLGPHCKDLTPERIAHHLANINRFNGGCAHPWSVAEHSLCVADRVALRHPTDHLLQLLALLHDGHEFILSDLPRPVESLLSHHMGPRFVGVWNHLKTVADIAILQGLGIKPTLYSWRVWYGDAITFADDEQGKAERASWLFQEAPTHQQICLAQTDGSLYPPGTYALIARFADGNPPAGLPFSFPPPDTAWWAAVRAAFYARLCNLVAIVKQREQEYLDMSIIDLP